MTSTEPARTTPSGRASILRFAVAFLLSATAMLAGYDLAEETTANDWYLLQVANSCGLLLKAVGHSCEVGRQDRFTGQEADVRAALAAWRQGENAGPLKAPKPQSERVQQPPLSQWECWAYEAGLRRQTLREAEKQGAKPSAASEDTSFGPRVDFVLSAGSTSASGASSAQPGLAFSFMVVPDCGAVQIVAIFVAAVLAFPVSWLARGLGAVLGSVVLFWVNAFRLTVLAVAGALDHGGPVYRFMHEYLWQAVYIAFVIAVWLAWVTWAMRRRGHADAQSNGTAAP